MHILRRLVIDKATTEHSANLKIENIVLLVKCVSVYNMVKQKNKYNTKVHNRV